MPQNIDMPKYDGPTEFIHFHAHSVYSMLDGVATPEQYFAACKERGWRAMAITEHGNMASVPDSYFAAKDNGVKYIPGCEIYFNDYEPERARLMKEGISIPSLKASNENLYHRIMKNRHLTVLASNQSGFTNLVKLTTQAHQTGFYYKPRIWFDKLTEYGDGLIILSGCLNGPVANELRQKILRTDDKRGAIDYIEKFKHHFGDRYYLEVQMPCLPSLEDFKVFWALVALGKKLGIKVILSNDAHYLTRQDFEVQKAMMAVDQGVTINDPNLFHVNSSEQYLKTREELWHTFKSNSYSKHVTDAEFHAMCDTTIEIADRCENYKPDRTPKVPDLPNAKDELQRRVLKAMMERGLQHDTRVFTVDNKKVTYWDQVKIELNRFVDKKFESYFLITSNLIKFSTDNGWPVGPRGSVGGSLVCYLLGITSMDPLVWGLSFDRFLSPSRGGFMLNIKAE